MPPCRPTRHNRPKRLALAPLACVLFALAGPAHAVLPDEILADPALEARARNLSQELRCPVCQGENIDDSNAAVARDLRVLLRDRLSAGDSDAQALDYITHRYGDYVLFNPRKSGANLLLWGLGPAVFLIALAGAGIWIRRRNRQPTPGPAPLDSAEARRLADLMRD